MHIPSFPSVGVALSRRPAELVGRRFGRLVPHVLTQYHHPETSEVSIGSTDPATGGCEGYKRTQWRMIVGGTG